MSSPAKVILMACGSFSPPTPMHLRMFEIARDHYREQGTHEVIGGVVSPVHDQYNKNGLVPAKHRCAMVKLSLQSSNWIRLSDWECNGQNQWTRTRISLQYHQNYINSLLNDINGTVNEIIPSWVPDNIKKYKGERVQMKLLCGADLLESFAVKNLWDSEDIEGILGEHGIVVITRAGTNPDKFIFESDLLTRFRNNITIVTNWVPNEVSSTMARRHLSRGLSVKYMLDDIVVEYIKQNNLFGAQNTKYILTPNQNEIIQQETLSPRYINDNYVNDKSARNNRFYDAMDETDFSSSKSLIVSDGETANKSPLNSGSNDDEPHTLSNGHHVGTAANGDGRECSNGEANQSSLAGKRRSQQVTKRSVTNTNGTCTIDLEDEVGQCKISTITLSPGNKQLQRRIEYLSDNQLDKICAVYGSDDENIIDSEDDIDDDALDQLSVEGLMPATTSRSQNDLIQFVFTSHGIRVISDKEYVV